jgi:hypothetical protein
MIDSTMATFFVRAGALLSHRILHPAPNTVHVEFLYEHGRALYTGARHGGWRYTLTRA